MTSVAPVIGKRKSRSFGTQYSHGLHWSPLLTLHTGPLFHCHLHQRHHGVSSLSNTNWPIATIFTTTTIMPSGVRVMFHISHVIQVNHDMALDEI